jgi:membrane peptidoglycan carboxypeptidase
VLDHTGAPLAGPDGAPLNTAPVCTPDAVPPAVATTLNEILVGDTALPIGTGTRAAIPGHQIAGKTGTSQNRFSVAFVGYTPKYAASVMLLNPKTNQDLGGYGGRLAAPIWRDALFPILSAEEAVPFPPAGMPLSDPRPPPPPPPPAPVEDPGPGGDPGQGGDPGPFEEPPTGDDPFDNPIFQD